jgi:hypothetical protein
VPEELRTAHVRSWGTGTEAVVTNYDDARWERMRDQVAPAAADVVPMTLEEIFIAVAGEDAGGAQ